MNGISLCFNSLARSWYLSSFRFHLFKLFQLLELWRVQVEKFVSFCFLRLNLFFRPRSGYSFLIYNSQRNLPYILLKFLVGWLVEYWLIDLNCMLISQSLFHVSLLWDRVYCTFQLTFLVSFIVDFFPAPNQKLIYSINRCDSNRYCNNGLEWTWG